MANASRWLAKAKGRSIEEAAGRVGMAPAEWAAMEAGSLPDPAKLRSIADALERGHQQMGILALLCLDAWRA